MDILEYINDSQIKIMVRPNSPKTEIIGWDSDRKALRVNVHAKPEDNEANIAIVKFFSKRLKKKVVIKRGLRSKTKLLEIK